MEKYVNSILFTYLAFCVACFTWAAPLNMLVLALLLAILYVLPAHEDFLIVRVLYSVCCFLLAVTAAMHAPFLVLVLTGSTSIGILILLLVAEPAE